MLQLEEYRKVHVEPNYERPHMTKEDLKKSRNELRHMNNIACIFLASIGLIFAEVAYATGTYILPTIGVLWMIIYYALVLIMADSKTKQSGNTYFLVHKEIVMDPEIGLSDCILIAYQPDTDMLHKVDVPYQVYRYAMVGDWFFMYVNSDNEYLVPEYPNAEWHLKYHKEGGLAE